jgi:hypothetical protein
MPTTTDFPFKCGKADAEYRASDPLFTSFRDASQAVSVTVPTVFGHGNSFQEWGMNGNDDWGDCVFAGGAHETELLTNLAAGGVVGQKVVTIGANESLSDYSAVTGFNINAGSPGENPTDQGTNVHAAMEYRIKTGLLDSTGKRHKIAGFVALEPGNLEHLRHALYIFEAVGIGFQVPRSAQEQFSRNQVWQVVAGNQEIVGGHYVPLVGVPAVGNLACVTWAKRQVMTDGFFEKYCDEAYAYITEEELNRKSQANWGGFNWSALKEYLQSAGN